jgi:hypothetical protein
MWSKRHAQQPDNAGGDSSPQKCWIVENAVHFKNVIILNIKIFFFKKLNFKDSFLNDIRGDINTFNMMVCKMDVKYYK